jgi:phosphohistidine phosphatase SixA
VRHARSQPAGGARHRRHALALPKLRAVIDDCRSNGKSRYDARMSKSILLLRHGEEPTAKPDLDLSVDGQRRAERLARFIPKAFGKPGAIFAAAPTSSSVRSYLTMRPLATSLGATIDASFKGEDYAPLAFRLLGDPMLRNERIVVCWTHNELPSLAAYLNVRRSDFPAQWPDATYNLLFVLTYKSGTRPAVKALTQPF